jgi:hypothetical protein
MLALPRPVIVRLGLVNPSVKLRSTFGQTLVKYVLPGVCIAKGSARETARYTYLNTIAGV